MREELRERFVAVYRGKLAAKGSDVGISFYAVFKNKNDEPDLLMEAATWWICTQRLDHFEKAAKVIKLIAQAD